MPFSSARSERGLSGRCRSAIIAVFETRGSATISVWSGLASRYWQRIGWLSAMLAPISRTTSAFSMSSYAPGGPSLPNDTLVARDGARHAERRVAVVVVGAEAELHQLAERVELFRHELPGAEDAERLRAVLRLRRTEALDHRADCLVPADAEQLAVLAQQRILRARLGVEGVVLGKTLRAELAAIHRMGRMRDAWPPPSVIHADFDAAADRAVAAGGRDPFVGDPLCATYSPSRPLRAVGVFTREIVDADQPLRCSCCAPARRRRLQPMFLGTTLTKKSQRPPHSPASATAKTRGRCEHRRLATSGPTMPAATRSASRIEKRACEAAGKQQRRCTQLELLGAREPEELQRSA